MSAEDQRERRVHTETDEPTNLSVENQPSGSARRPRDTLDQKAKRDPLSGGTIPADYDPHTMTRRGEEQDTRAGREGAGKRSASATGQEAKGRFAGGAGSL